MATVFEQYDASLSAFINPSDIKQRIPNFPKIAISCFSHVIIEQCTARAGVKEIAELNTGNRLRPVYEIEYKGRRVAVYLSNVGAPASAAEMEEIIAMGAEKLIFFGSCGVLDTRVGDGEILMPTVAVRDEGTSYHYLPPSEEIPLDPQGLSVLRETLERLGYSYFAGKTWTTDAIYRETVGRVRERKEAGCIAVEMECAALQAIAQFRGVGFLQFLYAADNLGAEQWEKRSLGGQRIPRADDYMDLALECVVHWLDREAEV